MTVNTAPDVKRILCAENIIFISKKMATLCKNIHARNDRWLAILGIAAKSNKRENSSFFPN
jgi:hypothetical protein